MKFICPHSLNPSVDVFYFLHFALPPHPIKQYVPVSTTLAHNHIFFYKFTVVEGIFTCKSMFRGSLGLVRSEGSPANSQICLTGSLEYFMAVGSKLHLKMMFFSIIETEKKTEGELKVKQERASNTLINFFERVSD